MANFTYFDSPIYPTKEDLFALTPLIHFIAGFRSDLSNLNLTNLEDRITLFDWWISNGRFIYSNVYWDLCKNDLDYLEEINILAKFDTNFSNFSFLLKLPLKINKVNIELLPYLNEVIEIKEYYGIKIPRFIRLLLNSRQDLNNLTNEFNLNGLMRFHEWWNLHGNHEYINLQWGQNDLLRALHEKIKIKEFNDIEIPKFIPLLLSSRPDLNTLFNLSSKEGFLGFINWWETYGFNEYPNLRWFTRYDDLFTNNSLLKNKIQVDVIGYGQGALGVGEDVRMASSAIEESGMGATIIIPPIDRPADMVSLASYKVSTKQNSPISLFCLPPQEMMRIVTESGRVLFGNDIYKIGAWPWELPFLKPPLSYASLLVNEVWAQSEFVYRSLSQSIQIPIIRMPMVVNIPNVSNLNNRIEFNLPKDNFIFYTVFDGNSWLSRKNPIASVLAFHKAFPKNVRGVSLVVKGMNINQENSQWIEILKIAKIDDRIILFEEILPKQKLIDFMACCDSFISLHRSEGFGRSIAEAMLLNQPVIVSNFSGNLDFCNAENAYLVDGELLPLKENDYAFGTSQFWFEPDISLAAKQMIKLFENQEERKIKALRGQLFISEHYSKEVVGDLYKSRFQKILSQI